MLFMVTTADINISSEGDRRVEENSQNSVSAAQNKRQPAPVLLSIDVMVKSDPFISGRVVDSQLFLNWVFSLAALYTYSFVNSLYCSSCVMGIFCIFEAIHSF